jgi:predicted DNA-binding transcriptional regulator YafY
MMMIASKNAVLRYRIIDRCIRSTAFPFPSKEELREACEEELYGSINGNHICESTIEKDLFAMRNEHDAPIKFSRMHKGYFYEDPDYSIDEIPLNDKDIDAIKMAANVLYQFKNSSLFKNFDFAISKILDRVNISDNVNDEDIENYVQFEKVNKIQGSEYLEVLLEAIKKKKKVQFSYQSFNNSESKIRRVHPYLLKEYRHRWYLIGKSEIKNRIQTFGLDRLSDLTKLDDQFSMDKSFDPDLFFKYSLGITANVGSPEKILIETEELLSKYLLSQPIHASQEYLGLSQEGKHLFKYFLLPTYELRTQLLGFGDEVKVLEPKSLAENLREICSNVIKQY